MTLSTSTTRSSINRLLLCLCLALLHVPTAVGSSGSPFSFRGPSSTSATTRAFGPRVNHHHHHHHPISAASVPPSSKRSTGFFRRSNEQNDGVEQDGDNDGAISNRKCRFPPRGGEEGGVDTFVRVVSTVTNILVQAGSIILPPTVAIARTIVGFYQWLPKDAIVAQVGLVYCFAGGYYPTLFSSLQAAQQYGWNVMVEAIQDLAEEAIRAIDALEADGELHATKFSGLSSVNEADLRRSFAQKTGVVMATVDPMKINQAAGALYMTWIGVRSVLEQEYARVITLSLTMARYIERVARFILAPPARLIVADKYHQWIPVVIGWGCKGAAMNIAWRIQRIMTAATSAVTGGLLFARAIARMLSKRGIRLFGLIREDDESTFLDEVIGFLVAGLGFYTQFESQWRSGFSFRVPFPLSLVTWPFDWAEKWIQWQITK